MKIKNILYASLFMYLASILQANIMLFLVGICEKYNSPIIIGFVLLFFNFIAYFLIVIIPIVVLHKKTPFKFVDVFLISALNYVLFAIYETPFQYLFVDTAEHGGLLFVDWKSEMPTYIASFWITIQYLIVMFVTLIMLKGKHKKTNSY